MEYILTTCRYCFDTFKTRCVTWCSYLI